MTKETQAAKYRYEMNPPERRVKWCNTNNSFQKVWRRYAMALGCAVSARAAWKAYMQSSKGELCRTFAEMNVWKQEQIRDEYNQVQEIYCA